MYFEQVRLNDCHISDFELGDILGTGSFGRVYFARHVPTVLVCCVKSISKAAIIKTKQVPLSSSKNPKHVSQSHNDISTNLHHINHMHISICKNRFWQTFWNGTQIFLVVTCAKWLIMLELKLIEDTDNLMLLCGGGILGATCPAREGYLAPTWFSFHC